MTPCTPYAACILPQATYNTIKALVIAKQAK
jgi:hypothetical protein